jgi:hypothetical protein
LFWLAVVGLILALFVPLGCLLGGVLGLRGCHINGGTQLTAGIAGIVAGASLLYWYERSKR